MVCIATIKDVAKLAGVSVATVSRVLNSSENVKDDTVETVNHAIEALGYHPNFLGRTLRRLETMKILVAVPTISNQFFSRVIKGIQAVAMENGYHVMISIPQSEKNGEQEAIEMLRRRLVDGVIFLSSANLSIEEANGLAKNYAVVFAGEYIAGADTPVVTIDDRKAAFDATDFLLHNGHRRICFVSAGDLYCSSALRRNGYTEALAKYGIMPDADLLFDEGFTFNAGKRAAKRLLTMKNLPDAIFATSDSTAIGVISALAAEGVKTGQDISVMGFDNNQIAEYFIPSLTTISQPQYEIGHKAMALLINKMRNLACENAFIQLPHKLEIRTSVRLTEGANRKDE